MISQVSLDAGRPERYLTKESTVDSLNNVLQRLSQTDWLPGRMVVGAKDLSDQNASAYDLQVRFSDVKIDYNTYQLYLSIHFIDPKTNAELAVIPARAYYGDDWGFVRYLRDLPLTRERVSRAMCLIRCGLLLPGADELLSTTGLPTSSADAPGAPRGSPVGVRRVSAGA